MRDFRPASAGITKEEAKTLDDLSTHPILPVLCYFPFAGTTLYLDLYALFNVELMHVFHLGASRMLNEAAVERLCCTTKMTDHYRHVKPTMRAFGSLLFAIIRQINSFVNEVTKQSDRIPLVLCGRNSEGDLF